MSRTRQNNFKSQTMKAGGFGAYTIGSTPLPKPTLPSNMNKPFIKRLIEWFK